MTEDVTAELLLFFILKPFYHSIREKFTQCIVIYLCFIDGMGGSGGFHCSITSYFHVIIHFYYQYPCYYCCKISIREFCEITWTVGRDYFSIFKLPQIRAEKQQQNRWLQFSTNPHYTQNDKNTLRFPWLENLGLALNEKVFKKLVMLVTFISFILSKLGQDFHIFSKYKGQSAQASSEEELK